MLLDTDNPLTPRTRDTLAQFAETADTSADFPLESGLELHRVGIPRWAVPREYGGLGLNPADYLRGTEALASACLTTAFLLSQRDAGVRRLLRHGSPELLAEWLPELADSRRSLTVGLSQLTTSRQHGRAAVAADPLGHGGYTINGVIPWVTGADRVDAIVAGATLEDGREVLFLLRPGSLGLTINEPMALSALVGSRTTTVTCQGVEVPPSDMLAGPVERILAGPSGGTGGLETSCLALGLAGAGIDWVASEADARPELRPLAERLHHERLTIRGLLAEAGNPDASADVISLRVRATRLALSATQATLMTAKGTGFVRPHPAQRWARQALFFLVWSCPRPAAEGLLAGLIPDCEDEP